VVVLTYDAPEAARRCVEALAAQSVPPAQVLVVDNAGARPAAPRVEEADTPFPVDVLRLAENLGPAGGYAVGLQRFLESGRTWAWVMDDDVLPGPTALERLLARAEVGGPRLLMPRVVVSGSGEEHRRPAWWGALLPRAVVEAVGLPRPELFWWAEDSEYLQFRVTRADFGTERVDDAVVTVDRERETAEKPEWKYFYEARNMTWFRLHAQQPRPGEPVAHMYRRRVRLWRAGSSVVRLAGRALLRERHHRARKVVMVLRGALDGARARLGKTLDPAPSESDRPAVVVAGPGAPVGGSR
jgi:rhamnopyranosyl-N-acetylglucosaminyl-diphospho-decaprenol beta-1,3/1,4-galactofuranosyltransferase